MGQLGSVSIEMRLGAESGSVRDLTPLARLVWRESLIDGGFSWSLTASSEQWSEWDPLILGPDDTTIRFRLKQADDGVERSTGWKRAIVDTSRTSLVSTALTTRVEGADRRLLMQQRARRRAWPASSVERIVRTIASEHGMTSDAAGSGPARDRWQVNEDDWSFLRRLVLRHADAAGRGDAFVWVDEDVVRLSAPRVAGVPADRRYVMAEVENRVDRILVTYSGREVDRDGGATLVGVGYDLAAGAPVLFRMDAGRAATHPALGRRVPRDPAGGLRSMPTTEPTVGLVENAARAVWGCAAPRYFGMRVDTRPDFSLRPGSVIEVNASLDARRQTPLHGRYLVLEVEHVVDGGAGSTSIYAYRREAYAGDAEPTGVAAAAGGSRDAYNARGVDAGRVVVVAREVGT